MVRELLAGRSPGRHIEILPPHQPIHPALLGPGGHEPKPLADALLTGCIELLPEVGRTMADQQMPAEALRMPAQTRALGFLLLVPIGDLDG